MCVSTAQASFVESAETDATSPDAATFPHVIESVRRVPVPGALSVSCAADDDDPALFRDDEFDASPRSLGGLHEFASGEWRRWVSRGVCVSLVQRERERERVGSACLSRVGRLSEIRSGIQESLCQIFVSGVCVCNTVGHHPRLR